MARGIDLTFQVIAQSKNQAVVGLLDAAFQSTSQSVRKLAGKILVSRRNRQGLEAIIRNFDPTNADLVELVNANRDKIVPGLHGAIVDKDVALARQAFRLAYTQNFYEVLPTLTAYCLGPGSQDKSSLSFQADFLRFLNKYTEALDKNDFAEHQFLYNTILPELSKALLHKMKEYRFTRHELALTVFLRLYPFFTDAGTDRDLNLQLRLPNSPVYVASYRRLLKESEAYLFKFITRCLDRLNPPPIVPQIISERSDIPFLDALFKSIKQPLTLEYKTNLAKLPPLVWIGQIGSFLNKFDPDAQCGLVLLAQNISIKEEELRACLLEIFERGNGKGRLAALSALAPFSNADIDRAIFGVSEEEEPALQIEALNQLSTRAVPGGVARIMRFAGSPHEAVRDTIKKLLPNFQFNRFFQSFDQLDDEQRRRMFDVVKKLDRQTPDELAKILSTGEPILRAKALLCIDYSPDIVPLIEGALCDVLIHDEMPKLRRKAAEQLVAGRRDESRMTLVQAFHRDTDPEVRTAAKNSLETRPTYWDQHEES